MKNQRPAYFALKYIICALLLTSATIAPAYATPQTLWPTDLTSTGDCLSDTLSAPTNAMQVQIDQTYCSTENAGDAKAINQCIQNAGTKTEIIFFSDKCGSEGETTAFASINGIEYRLDRITSPIKSHSTFTGLFADKDNTIRLYIAEPTAVIKDSSEDDSDLKMIKMAVPVTIMQKNHDKEIEQHQFQAILTHFEPPE